MCKDGYTNESFENYKSDKTIDYNLIQSKISFDFYVVTSSDWFKALIDLVEKLEDESLIEMSIETINFVQEESEKLKNTDKLRRAKLLFERKVENLENENVDDIFDLINSRRNQPDTSNILLENMIKGFEMLSESNRSNKKLRIETLKNDTQDIQEWFDKFERQTNQWTDADRGSEVPVFFEDAALRYWEIMPEKHKNDYYEVKHYLLKKFRAEDHVFKSMKKFYAMQQEHNESVEDFVYRLHRCKKDWPTSDHTRFDQDLPHIFKNGLKPDIAAYIISYSYKSIEDLIKKAKESETVLRKKEEGKSFDNNLISTESAISENINKKCYKCQKSGHFAKECIENLKENTKYEFSKNKVKPQCMFCGRLNHYAIDCFALKQQNFKISSEKYKSSEKSKLFCTICKLNNHSNENCRNKQKSLFCGKCKKKGHIATDCKQQLNE